MVTNANNAASTVAVVKVNDVSVDDAMKTSQFYLLGTTFFCVATGGMGLLSVAKPMMSEVFSSLLPGVVTSAFASSFLLMLSGGNLGENDILYFTIFSLKYCIPHLLIFTIPCITHLTYLIYDFLIIKMSIFFARRKLQFLFVSL